MKRFFATFCLFTLSIVEGLISAFCLCWGLAPSVAEAQTTHNLDIIWHCPKPDTFPWKAWGYAIAAGDFNNDSYVDIVSSVWITQNFPVN